MILTPDDTLKVLKKPDNASLLKRAKALLVSHRMHLKGCGVDDYLSRLEGYENEDQHKLRQRLAKPFTVPLLAPEMVTFESVFTAQGASRYYDIAGENADMELDFRNYLNGNVGEGRTLAQVMRQVWLDKVNMDSTGVLMIELPVKPTAPYRNPYITFRSVMDMWDVGFTGTKVEYLIFVSMEVDAAGKQYQKFRVIDDAQDVVYYYIDGKYILQADLTLVNEWGYVPATFVSNQIDGECDCKTSYIWPSISILDEILVDASVHGITKYLHGFPLYWQRERGCRDCNGIGWHEQIQTSTLDDDSEPGPAVRTTCRGCHGTGISLKRDVSDIISIPRLESKEQADNVPVAGYITPDIAIIQDQRTEISWLRSVVHMGIWSADETKSMTNTDTAPENGAGGPETATGRMLDVQAIYKKLSHVSENAEHVEKFLVDTLGHARYPGRYNACTINYGRRYFILSAFELESLYEAAKTGGLPQNMLAQYREEIVHVRWGADQVMLTRAMKLNALEPFPDFKIAEITSFGLPQEDLFMKIYFNEYVSRFEEEGNSILLTPITAIREKFKLYNAEKVTASQAQKTAELQQQQQFSKPPGGFPPK